MNPAIGKLQGIVDIIPPLTPASHQWQSILIIVGLLLPLLVIIFFLSRRYYSARGKALRKLKKLSHTLHQTQTEKSIVPSQTLPSQLATVLRRGLRLQQLTTRTTLPINLLNHQERWKLFIGQLTEACYANNRFDLEELEKLLNDAKFWLRYWP